VSFEYRQKIPTVDEIMAEMPLSKKLADAKKLRDQEIANIFTRESNRFLLVIGPCSQIMRIPCVSMFPVWLRSMKKLKKRF
jgi:phospho-2-dehydro-3-deoxyheptonate aldolase